MSQTELAIGRTVIRTVKFEFTAEEVEAIVAAHVKRTHGVKLKDFTLTADLGETEPGDDDVACIVTGEARTDGLAPTRKRKARA